MHDFYGTFRDLLHAANLRHGTDGFTSPPKEGVLRILSPLKIRRLRPGLNPRSWVPKASTLPLDHRSRYLYHTVRKRTSHETCQTSQSFTLTLALPSFFVWCRRFGLHVARGSLQILHTPLPPRPKLFQPPMCTSCRGQTTNLQTTGGGCLFISDTQRWLSSSAARWGRLDEWTTLTQQEIQETIFAS